LFSSIAAAVRTASYWLSTGTFSLFLWAGSAFLFPQLVDLNVRCCNWWRSQTLAL